MNLDHLSLEATRSPSSFVATNIELEKRYGDGQPSTLTVFRIEADGFFPIHRGDPKYDTWDTYDSFGTLEDDKSEIRRFRVVIENQPLNQYEFTEEFRRERLNKIGELYSTERHVWAWFIESEQELCAQPPTVAALYSADNQNVTIHICVPDTLMRNVVQDIENNRIKTLGISVEWHPILRKDNCLDGDRFVLASFLEAESPKAFGYFATLTTSEKETVYEPTFLEEIESRTKPTTAQRIKEVMSGFLFTALIVFLLIKVAAFIE